MNFAVSGSLFGAALACFAVFAALVLPKKPEMWKTLPRERKVGTVIGVCALIWSAYLVYPILEGDFEKFRRMLPVLVIVVSVCSALYLEYLFSRALGGIMLLSVNFIMHEAFVYHAPFRPALTVICYILGLVGLFMVGAPWRFRDLLEKMSKNQSFRNAVAGGLGLCALACVAIALGTLR